MATVQLAARDEFHTFSLPCRGINNLWSCSCYSYQNWSMVAHLVGKMYKVEYQLHLRSQNNPHLWLPGSIFPQSKHRKKSPKAENRASLEMWKPPYVQSARQLPYWGPTTITHTYNQMASSSVHSSASFSPTKKKTHHPPVLSHHLSSSLN